MFWKCTVATLIAFSILLSWTVDARTFKNLEFKLEQDACPRGMYYDQKPGTCGRSPGAGQVIFVDHVFDKKLRNSRSKRDVGFSLPKMIASYRRAGRFSASPTSRFYRGKRNGRNGQGLTKKFVRFPGSTVFHSNIKRHSYKYQSISTMTRPTFHRYHHYDDHVPRRKFINRSRAPANCLLCYACRAKNKGNINQNRYRCRKCTLQNKKYKNFRPANRINRQHLSPIETFKSYINAHLVAERKNSFEDNYPDESDLDYGSRDFDSSMKFSPLSEEHSGHKRPNLEGSNSDYYEDDYYELCESGENNFKHSTTANMKPHTNSTQKAIIIPPTTLQPSTKTTAAIKNNDEDSFGYSKQLSITTVNPVQTKPTVLESSPEGVELSCSSSLLTTTSIEPTTGDKSSTTEELCATTMQPKTTQSKHDIPPECSTENSTGSDKTTPSSNLSGQSTTNSEDSSLSNPNITTTTITEENTLTTESSNTSTKISSSTTESDIKASTRETSAIITASTLPETESTSDHSKTKTELMGSRRSCDIPTTSSSGGSSTERSTVTSAFEMDTSVTPSSTEVPTTEANTEIITYSASLDSSTNQTDYENLTTTEMSTLEISVITNKKEFSTTETTPETGVQVYSTLTTPSIISSSYNSSIDADIGTLTTLETNDHSTTECSTTCLTSSSDIPTITTGKQEEVSTNKVYTSPLPIQSTKKSSSENVSGEGLSNAATGTYESTTIGPLTTITDLYGY